MGEEFQAEVSWWNISSRNNAMFGSSPCSSAVNLDLGSFGWPADFLDIKTRCSAKHSLESDESNSASDGSIVIQDHFHHKPNKHQESNAMVDSSLQFLGSIGLSSSTTTTADPWDPSLINGSPDDQSNNYPPNILQQQSHNSSMNYGQESCPPPQDIQNTFSTIDSSSSINQQDGFPINSVSYGYPSSLLQTLFDDATQQQQPAFYAANQAMNYQLQQPNPAVNMQFPAASQKFCNGEADFRAGFFPSSQPQFVPSTFDEKANLPSFTTKANVNDEVQGKKSGSEQAFKRPRIETPSPLPTFKVRKEKLGDRITALQQLVSPFGKTDTASVLHEAIEYIKFLHDQVNMLSTPYKKNGSPIHRGQQQQQTSVNKDGSKEDLKSKGLCLVPISSTFPVAAETTADFWTPTFGGTFR